jgi:ADP-heptose:LPS heptosyltransferase
MENTILPGVNKIAVFRALALGDFIFALPALEALRGAYPQAEIVYLGREWHCGFIPGRIAGPHRVISVPPVIDRSLINQGLVIDPQYEQAFVNKMRAEGFDLALQLHGGGDNSNPFVLKMGSRYSAGMKSPTAVPLDRWVPYIYYQNEVARLLEVVSLVGGFTLTSRLMPSLTLLDSDHAAAEPFLNNIHGPFALIHPGSTDPRRCWSPLKFAAVGDYLASQGMTVVLVGTSMDAWHARAVTETMQAPVLDLCSQLTLPALVGLLAHASIFAGNDSGPLHLALSVGTRSVGLFWVEYIVNSLPLPRASFYPLIAWQRACAQCGRFCDKAEIDHPSGSCSHQVSFVDEITPAHFIRGVEAMLSL